MMGSPYDIPPLVDPEDLHRGYPPTNYTPAHPHGAGSRWGAAGWGDPVMSAAPGWTQSPNPGLTAAGYPTYGAQTFPTWSQSQQPPWAQQTPPWHPAGDPWQNPSPAAFVPGPSQYPPPFLADASPGRLGKYPSPLTRSQSILQNDLRRLSYSPGSASPFSLQRSSSVGPRHNGDIIRRPRDWRPDFKFRTGFAALLPRRQRTLSTPTEPEYYDDVKREPHKFLQYSSFSPHVHLDLRDDPMTVRFHDLGRHFDRNDLMQYACDPVVPFMRLYHEKLPWYIDIYARNRVAVTIHDLFDQMHDSLMLAILSKDYYNDELDDEDRSKVGEAFKDRCGGRDNEIAKGVRRVDFLRGRVIFEGISRGKHGMWELKSRKSPR